VRCACTIIKGEFADDVVLMAKVEASCCKHLESVCEAFGMTVSIPKTKFMVVGSEVHDEKSPIAVDSGMIEWVSESSYLSSLIGRIDVDNRACVLSVLLYGCECWIPLRRHLKRLNALRHRCVGAVLGSPTRGSGKSAYHLQLRCMTTYFVTRSVSFDFDTLLDLNMLVNEQVKP
jgi:hypothetical protein